MSNYSKYYHLITLNVQGLRDNQKRLRLLQWIKEQRADVIFLQETHFTPDIVSRVNSDFADFHTYHSFGSNLSKGCSVLINKKLNVDIIDTESDENGRFVFINLNLYDDIFSLLSLYAPNDRISRNTFFDDILTLLKSSAQGSIIIGGDFNDVMTCKDRISKSDLSKSSNTHVIKLQEVITELDLIDVWRYKNNDTLQFTWRRTNGVERSRIDYWLISQSILPRIMSCDIRPALIKSTDHLAVSLKLNIPDKRGPGYWKLNNSYLDDKEYIDIITNVINICKIQNLSASQLLWETCKHDIKISSIQYGKNKAKIQRNEIRKVESLHQRLSNELLLSPDNNQLKTEITNVEAEIENLYHYRAKGAQIRSRLQLLEEGEKNTKYFHNLEKSRQTRKNIISLKKDNVILNNIKDILNEEVRFYSDLYRTPDHNPNIENYVNDTLINSKLSDQDANICDGLITELEAKQALFNMKLNKSPGCDGLTVEFYRTFWSAIKDSLINSINESYNSNQLSYTQRQSIISLIYKKGDPENLENWRPISLLNIDYKILTSCLASRMQKVLPKIIHTDQQGYIKERNIAYNIRQIQDVIDYANILNLEGAVLFLDFKKAFDTVDRKFLIHALKKFGFHENFIHWIETIYTNIFATVINNGWKSDKISLNRGVRQGCPLSALLYIIVAEILSNKIRSNENIEGIKITLDNDVCPLKITQLADDTTLFVCNDSDILNAIATVDEFSNYSGLYLNKHKTEGLWIGRTQERNIGGIKWSKEVKALGVWFGKNKEKCEQLNWDSKLHQCRQLIEKWNKRYLTIYGKTVVIKSILLPKFIYLFQSSAVPANIISKLKSVFFKFLWGNKTEKIKRKILINTIEDGGINMVDVDSFCNMLKIKWAKQLLSNDNANWKVIPRYVFNKIGSNFLFFYMDITTLKQLPINQSILSPFYIEIMKSWLTYKHTLEKKPTSYWEIRKQILFGNKYILFQNKTLMYKSWIDSGILFVNDVINNEGNIDHNVILSKLRNKANWISETEKLKKAIPSNWKTVLKTEQSRLSKVKTTLTFNTQITASLQNNRTIYRRLLKQQVIKPYLPKYWETKLNNHDIDWNTIYLQINKLHDNRFKQFRYKLLNNIINTNENLYKWKVINSPRCCFCNEYDDLDHFFITCPILDTLWLHVGEKLSQYIDKPTRLFSNIILGYKYSEIEYFGLNLFFTIVGFSIFKYNVISERRTKVYSIIDILSFECKVANEYLKRKHKESKILKLFIRDA